MGDLVDSSWGDPDPLLLLCIESNRLINHLLAVEAGKLTGTPATPLTEEEWERISCMTRLNDYDGPMATVDEQQRNVLLAQVENVPCDGLIVIAVREGKVLEAHTALSARQRAFALASVLAATPHEEET
jgi:hypothetical protein